MAGHSLYDHLAEALRERGQEGGTPSDLANEVLEVSRGHVDDASDLALRLGWLVFAHAKSLDPLFVAFGPMYVGQILQDQFTWKDLLDMLAAKEDPSSSARHGALQVVHGKDLESFVSSALGQQLAGSRMDAVADGMESSLDAQAARGQWNKVPLHGPDAIYVRQSLSALDNDSAYKVWKRWGRAAKAAEGRDMERALAALDEAAEAGPDVFETFVRRATYRQIARDVVGAGADIERAIHLQPRSTMARWLRGDLRTKSGDQRGAEDDYDLAVAGAPTHVPYRMSRGYLLFSLGRTREALADFNAAVDAHPENTQVYFHRADIHARLKNYPLALEDYAKVLELQPDHSDARQARGTVRLMTGDVSGAWGDFTALVKERPSDPLAWARCAGAAKSNGADGYAWLDAMTSLALCEPAWEFLPKVDEMRMATEHGATSLPFAKLQERADLIERVAPGHPTLRFANRLGQSPLAGDPDALRLRARAYSRYGQWQDAMGAWSELAAAYPNDPEVAMEIGRVMLHNNQAQQAWTALERATAHRDGLDAERAFELSLLVGRAAGTLGQLATAVQSFEQALDLKPNRADVWFYKGIHLDLMEKREDAVNAYTRSVELDDAFSPAWFNRACEYALLGQKASALSDLRRAIALKPDWAAEAKKDSYFASLWADPEFQAVVA